MYRGIRRGALTMALAVALLAGCGPATPATVAPAGSAQAVTPAPVEPAKAVVENTFSIGLYFTSDNEGLEAFRKVADHLQSLLRRAGWNVELQVIFLNFQDGGGARDAMFNAYRGLSAAGHAPDAYQVDPATAKLLRSEGITQDLSAVLPRSAPLLYERYRPLFADAVDGIPTKVYTQTRGGPIVLLMNTLELNAYGQPITNAEDILTFLEKRTEVGIAEDEWGNAAICDVWAAQKGYYSLFSDGRPNYLYARMDDAACAPVPLEDIDGFTDFYRRQAALRAEGRLNSLYLYEKEKKIGGRLSQLGSPSIEEKLYKQRKTGLAGKDTTALLLQGCAAPELPADAPFVMSLLAVDAASDQADAVAAFAQWMMTDPQGYGLCVYGQKDVDYRMVGDRMEYLNAGAELVPADLSYETASSAFFRFRDILVYNPIMERPTVYDPINVEQALAQSKAVLLPIWRIPEIRDSPWQLPEDISAAMQPYQELLDQRASDIGYIVAHNNNNVPEFTPEQVLARIMDNRPKLSPMIEELSQQLKDMLAKSLG